MTKAIYCDAVGTTDDWTLGAGADKVVAVGSPDDEDTSYIFGSSYSNQQYTLEAPGIPAGSTINSVSPHARCRTESGSDIFLLGVFIPPDYTNSGWKGTGTSYADFEESLARPGGGAWQLSDLDDLRIYINAGPTTIRATSFWIIVDYTPPAPAPTTGAMLLLF